MFQPTEKGRSVVGVYLSILLCCAVIISSIMVAPPTAEASGTKAQVDKLIQDWSKRYGGSDIWKVKPASPEEVAKAKKAGNPYRIAQAKGHVEQMKALRTAVDAVLKKYDLTPSMLAAYYPSFGLWVDKNDRPYWRIVFNLKSKENVMLKPITVHVDAISGKVTYTNSGNVG